MVRRGWRPAVYRSASCGVVENPRDRFGFSICRRDANAEGIGFRVRAAFRGDEAGCAIGTEDHSGEGEFLAVSDSLDTDRGVTASPEGAEQ